MKYKIVADSSSNVYEVEGVDYAYAPLKIVVGDNTFTEYGKELYKPILQAKFEITEDYIEVFCDNEDLGNDFVMTIAGYTSESRYNKIIKEK